MKIIEELRKKESPFLMPTNYFDDMQDKISSQAYLQVGVDSGMEVPTSYFENMQQQVLADVQETAKVIDIKSRKWWSIAASMIVVMGAAIWLWPNIDTEEKSSSIAALNIEESVELAALMSDEFTLEDYAEFLTEEDLESLTEELEEEVYLENLDLDQLIELEKTF